MTEGKPRFVKAFRDSTGCVSNVLSLPPSAFACDVVCPGGMYGCGRKATKILGGYDACECTQGKCAGFPCVDAIKAFGEDGR